MGEKQVCSDCGNEFDRDTMCRLMDSYFCPRCSSSDRELISVAEQARDISTAILKNEPSISTEAREWLEALRDAAAESLIACEE